MWKLLDKQRRQEVDDCTSSLQLNRFDWFNFHQLLSDCGAKRKCKGNELAFSSYHFFSGLKQRFVHDTISMCSDSVISKQWALIAAHCIEDAVSINLTTERFVHSNDELVETHSLYSWWFHFYSSEMELRKVSEHRSCFDPSDRIRVSTEVRWSHLNLPREKSRLNWSHLRWFIQIVRMMDLIPRRLNVLAMLPLPPPSKEVKIVDFLSASIIHWSIDSSRCFLDYASIVCRSQSI